MRWALRILLIVGVSLAATALLGWVTKRAGSVTGGQSDMVVISVLLAILIAYAVLIAIPFVPGIEIGLTLLMLNGPAIAPYVYLASVLGLLMGYGVGRWMPQRWILRIFQDLRLTKATALIKEVHPLDTDQRVDLLRTRLPKWARKRALQFRYVGVAILINVPGNTVIGGGGGIMIMSGLTGVFKPLSMTITAFLACLPGPLAYWLFGASIF